MKPTKRSQPYRRGAGTRGPGSVLSAMLAGRTAAGTNPADQKRSMQKRGSALSRALSKRLR